MKRQFRLWGQRPWLDRFELSRALLVAGIFSLATPRVGFGRLWGAVKAWGRLARDGGALASTALYKRRMAVCWRCPFYSRAWGTCGSPLEKVLRSVGCWCSMRAKARYADSRCWIDDELSTGNGRLHSYAGHGWRANGADSPGWNPQPRKCCPFTVTITRAGTGNPGPSIPDSRPFDGP